MLEKVGKKECGNVNKKIVVTTINSTNINFVVISWEKEGGKLLKFPQTLIIK